MSSDPLSVLTQNKTSCLTTAFLKIFPPLCVLALVPLLASGPDSAVASCPGLVKRNCKGQKRELLEN